MECDKCTTVDQRDQQSTVETGDPHDKYREAPKIDKRVHLHPHTINPLCYSSLPVSQSVLYPRRAALELQNATAVPCWPFLFLSGYLLAQRIMTRSSKSGQLIYMRPSSFIHSRGDHWAEIEEEKEEFTVQAHQRFQPTDGQWLHWWWIWIIAFLFRHNRLVSLDMARVLTHIAHLVPVGHIPCQGMNEECLLPQFIRCCYSSLAAINDINFNGK